VKKAVETSGDPEDRNEERAEKSNAIKERRKSREEYRDKGNKVSYTGHKEIRKASPTYV